MSRAAQQSANTENKPQRLEDVLSRLVEFDSGGLPVVSLYLNAQADKHGRDQFDRFVRRELSTRRRTFEPHTREGESFQRDAERFLGGRQRCLRPSALHETKEQTMTKSNVNPNHYKTAGRERQGDGIVQEIYKQKLAQEEAERAGREPGEQNFIPGAAPVGESRSEAKDEAASDSTETVGQVNETANSSSRN